MERLSAWIYRRFGHRAVFFYLGLEAVTAFVLTVVAIGILSLYQHMTAGQYWLIVAFCYACVLAASATGAVKLRRQLEPLFDWMRGRRDQRHAREAWNAAVTSPRRLVTNTVWWQTAFIHIPAPLFIVLLLHLPAYSFFVIAAGSAVTAIYAALLHFFYAEIALRPAVREIAACLPADFGGRELSVPLRWKLLGALPLINVITGVVVSGLSGSGSHSLSDLGVSVVVAVAVAFTLSLELTALVTRSVMTPLRDVLAVIPRVKEGDFSARVPVISGDEMGELARSFNDMVAGLDERERLREAFGSYVDPEVADRVLEEGTTLEGEEVEVTIVFIDICEFTSFAENASARETVEYLNDFFGLVVPLLLKHGGHANKYIGDGVLGVFGAPERRPDHADRAVAAAMEIADGVQRRYGDELRIGVGVNSGPVSAGSIGGGGRLEFTVIGDPVNVAARVEEATRDMGDRVLVTESTRALMAPDSPIRLEPRGSLPVRGRTEPVNVYAPVAARVRRPEAERAAYGG
ncbi:MAG: adenylate/guanylate cyclase domain-containing protein [Thermoleophilaceae bacterium]